MSWRLVAEVLYHAPPMTPAERLLLVALAEGIHDGDRHGFVPQDRLRLAVGLSDDRLRRAVQRIEERLGEPIRVEKKVGTDGRPVYAWRGKSTLYRLPEFGPPPGCMCQSCHRKPSRSDGALRESDTSGDSKEKAPSKRRESPIVSSVKPHRSVPESPIETMDPSVPGFPVEPGGSPSESADASLGEPEDQNQAALKDEQQRRERQRRSRAEWVATWLKKLLYENRHGVWEDDALAAGREPYGQKVNAIPEPEIRQAATDLRVEIVTLPGNPDYDEPPAIIWQLPEDVVDAERTKQQREAAQQRAVMDGLRGVEERHERELLELRNSDDGPGW